MAIGAIFRGQFSEAQYRQVKDQVAPGNRPVQGLLYHAAGPIEDGFCVVEIWESQERLQHFFDEQLGQALEEAGFSVQPQFFEVVNTMQPDH